MKNHYNVKINSNNFCLETLYVSLSDTFRCYLGYGGRNKGIITVRTAICVLSVFPGEESTQYDIRQRYPYV